MAPVHIIRAAAESLVKNSAFLSIYSSVITEEQKEEAIRYAEAILTNRSEELVYGLLNA